MVVRRSCSSFSFFRVEVTTPTSRKNTAITAAIDKMIEGHRYSVWKNWAHVWVAVYSALMSPLITEIMAALPMLSSAMIMEP
ncbi:hypothetical protein D3C77_546870 [compost metagenome]